MKSEKRQKKWLKGGGFTLVELIVVIAILGVLSGVAVPVYNGYIKKTNMAADAALIAEINQAAATAVLEVRGEDMSGLDAGKLLSNAAKGTSPISVWDRNTENVSLQQAFEKYFAGNEDASLKWYGSIQFVNEDGFSGRFIGTEPNMTSPLDDKFGAADAFKASSYNNLGVPGVTMMVDDLVGALKNFTGLDLIADSDAFQQVLENMGVSNASDPQTLANASVFYLAACLEELNQDELLSHITGTEEGGLNTYLVGKQVGTKEDGTPILLNNKDATFIATALNYALATSFAYSDLVSSDPVSAQELRDAMSNTPGDKAAAWSNITTVTEHDLWPLYLADGGADFDAFYKVMQVLNDNKDTFVSLEGNGMFSNAEIQAAIETLLNGTT